MGKNPSQKKVVSREAATSNKSARDHSYPKICQSWLPTPMKPTNKLGTFVQYCPSTSTWHPLDPRYRNRVAPIDRKPCNKACHRHTVVNRCLILGNIVPSVSICFIFSRATHNSTVANIWIWISWMIPDITTITVIFCWPTWNRRPSVMQVLWILASITHQVTLLQIVVTQHVVRLFLRKSIWTLYQVFYNLFGTRSNWLFNHLWCPSIINATKVQKAFTSAKVKLHCYYIITPRRITTLVSPCGRNPPK